MLDSGVVIFIFYFRKGEVIRTQTTQEYSPDLTIRLTDKEYDQYVKKGQSIKISYKDEKRDGR
jgi:hypothetical protein